MSQEEFERQAENCFKRLSNLFELESINPENSQLEARAIVYGFTKLYIGVLLSARQQRLIDKGDVEGAILWIQRHTYEP